MTANREYRVFKSEVRASKNSNPTIEGYAAVFNTITNLGWLKEQIAPGAFANAINEKQDVRALFNHDPNNILGRTKSGTLTLSEDNTGLKFSVDMPNTSVGKDVYAMIQRGDIDQCSFGFVVRDEEVSYDDEGAPTRIIKQADLFDVSPVTYPAYPTTSVEARSNADVLAKFKRDAEDEDDDEEPSTECACRCRACFDGECDECEKHINDCQADNCDHEPEPDDSEPNDNNTDGNADDPDDDDPDDERSKELRAAGVTKKVDGEDLTAADFLYVGDSKKTSTWALPWHFSSEAKTKGHLRNALARFSQTDKIPASEKPAVYKKLVAKCKAHGIDVSESKAAADTDNLETAKRLTYLAQISL